MSNITAFQLAIQANVPTIWWDEPGVGKTFLTHAFADSVKWPMDVLILSTCEPSDIGGLPIADEAGLGYRRLISSRIQALVEATKKAGGGILFLDELPTAAPAVQAVALRVTQADPTGTRWMGDYPLPAELRVVAAGNPTEHSAGGWELTAPLANRFYHHTGRPSTEEWVKGMRSGFTNPPFSPIAENWREHIGLYRAYIATFIRVRPSMLLQVPSAEAELGKAWPSPRSWDMAATLLAASHDYGQDVQMQLLSGTVGDGAAAEYIGWYINMNLPTPKEALDNPKIVKKPTPEEEHRLYAILAGACAYVREHPDKAMWDKLWALLLHVSKWGADIVFAFTVEISEEIKVLIKDGAPIVPKEGIALLKRIACKSGMGKVFTK